MSSTPVVKTQGSPILSLQASQLKACGILPVAGYTPRHKAVQALTQAG